MIETPAMKPDARMTMAARRKGGTGKNTAHPDAPAFRSSYTPGYSRFVTVLKFFLPLVALVLISLIVLWPALRPEDNTFRIGFSDIDSGRDERPSLQNARFFGADDKQQPYSISSDLVTQVSEDDSVVDLEKPKADIAMKDGTWLVLTAKTGRFFKPEAKLDLNGDVNLFHDTGYEFHTQKASIDMNAGTASGDEPVFGQGPFGELQAEGFRLLNRGSRLVFTGQSKLVLFNGLGGGNHDQ